MRQLSGIERREDPCAALCFPRSAVFVFPQSTIFLLIFCAVSAIINQQSKIRGYSSSVERQLPKLNRRVRLPLSAPRKRGSRRLPLFRGGIRMKGVERSNPTARWAVGRRHPRRRILCFAAGKTQTTPFIRSIVGDPSARLRKPDHLTWSGFLRLCFGSPPLPAEARFGGAPFFVFPINLIGRSDHSVPSM